LNNAPTLAGFNAILEKLAADPRGRASDQDEGYPYWVRHSVAAGGTKLRVLRHLLRNVPSGEVPCLLDLGAQVGAMAAYATQLGFRVSAVDYQFYARRFAPMLAAYGVQYTACDVGREPLPYADASFHFVTYMDVIEHHSFSPRRVLAEIRRVLQPGGQVIITTPNHTSIYNRLSLLAGRSVNDGFDHYFDVCGDMDTYPGHHREFTRAELRRALERSAFRVRECRVFDESPASQWYFMRHNRGANGDARGFHACANLGAAVAGKVFEAARLPFGRLLWAVGEKAG
jgi:2-polyprenyl-3-methyl-5-hydroxy-6-metoxy-1,4-benzoquinol methylase